jgi:hypothetical protein
MVSSSPKNVIVAKAKERHSMRIAEACRPDVSAE